MRSEIQAVAWRSYWPVALLAVTFLAVVGLFGAYVNSRQQVANARAEKQRGAICAILANIPGHIPAEIVTARAVFARPGHPNDCQPVAHPTPKPTPMPATTVTVTPTSRQTVEIVQPARTTSPSATPRPTPTRTASPSQSPIPRPSPSRSCILIVCTRGANGRRAAAAEGSLSAV